ncbi:MAG: hypothetical protein RIC51_03445 [Erythrobacter sp.]|uniref:hypothetical protein n=1 Tax=Erythrobacter sp. TaxID=1042 RepID=UPI0032ED191B
MILLFSPAAAVAALFVSPAFMAQHADAGANGATEVEAEAEAGTRTESEPGPEAGASPVRLLDFDGGWQFLKTSSRLRIVRPSIDYTLTVDAAGDVTGCELRHEFRRTYINERLCDVLIAHHTFEPAHDASGTAVAGSYSSRLVYADLRADL